MCAGVLALPGTLNPTAKHFAYCICFQCARNCVTNSIFFRMFRSDKSKSQQNNTEEKRPFLEPDSIALLPTGVGKLQQLVRLPPLTDIHEWLATNCESQHTAFTLHYHNRKFCNVSPV